MKFVYFYKMLYAIQLTIDDITKEAAAILIKINFAAVSPCLCLSLFIEENLGSLIS